MFEKKNESDSFSNVEINCDDEKEINSSYLLSDHSLADFPQLSIKRTFRILSILVISSIFMPSPIENTEKVHYFDSKHYPNYTILADISKVPKYSTSGLYLSLQFKDFEIYKYEPKNSVSNSEASSNITDERLINKAFKFTGNLKMKFDKEQNKKLISLVNNESDINVNFEHFFYVQDFFTSQKTNQFIIFADKFPNYSALAMNLTINAQHPRPQQLIFSFRYSSKLYELFELFLRLTLLAILITETSFRWLLKMIFKNISNEKDDEDTMHLNVQQILTFILEILAILYVAFPIFSGSISFLSLQCVCPFFTNLNLIIHDFLFTFVLFYILSLFSFASQNTSNYTNLNQENNQETSDSTMHQSDKTIVVECYNSKFSSLVYPFLFISPFFVFHALRDIEIFDKASSYLNSTIITIAASFDFKYTTLLSYNILHFVSFIIFVIFFFISYSKIRKYIAKFDRLSNRKDKYQISLKSKIYNYMAAVIPLIMLFSIAMVRPILSLSARKTQTFTPVINSQELNMRLPKLNFSSYDLHEDYIGTESSITQSNIIQFLYLYYYEPKTAFFSTFHLVAVVAFTLFMSALHAPISLFSE